MLDGFIYIISAILMLIGMSSIINFIIHKLTSTGRNDNIYTLVCLKDGDAELALRDALEHVRYAKNSKNDGIIAVDIDLDNETKEVCKLFCGDNSNIIFCDTENLSDVLMKSVNHS